MQLASKNLLLRPTPGGLFRINVIQHMQHCHEQRCYATRPTAKSWTLYQCTHASAQMFPSIGYSHSQQVQNLLIFIERIPGLLPASSIPLLSCLIKPEKWLAPFTFNQSEVLMAWGVSVKNTSFPPDIRYHLQEPSRGPHPIRPAD